MVRRLRAGAAIFLFAVVALGPAAAMAAAVHVPAPVTRVHPAHRLVALTLHADSRFRAWPALLDVLRAGGAQATLFVTTRQIRDQAGELRALRRSGQVEIGLTGASQRSRGSGLLQDGEEAERMLGDRIGVYQPLTLSDAARVAREAYTAGLVTVLWSRAVAHDPLELARVAKEVRPGEIVRFDLPDDRASLAQMGAALAALSDRNLLATSASGLIEDSAQHLQYCTAALQVESPVARAQVSRTAAGRVLLARIYPGAGLAPRALWHLGRPGEFAVRRLYGVKPGVRLGDKAIGGLLDREVRQLMAREAQQRYVAPSGATLTYPEGKVVRDLPGRRVDVQATIGRIWRAKKDAQIEPVMRIVFARWRTADIEALTDVLGQYRTWIAGSAGRYMNVQKGAGRINNRIIFPGQTFSTLGAIGDVAKQPGWHKAPVIVWGSYAEGVGGGLCQVSSTLYNAVQRANLKIVERHHHAIPVHYVPRGRDATIAWPDLDFRFANPRSTPVVLKAYVRGGALWTIVLGKATA